MSVPLTPLTLQLPQQLDGQLLGLPVVLVDVEMDVEAFDDYKTCIGRAPDQITARRPNWLLTSRQIQGDSRA